MERTRAYANTPLGSAFAALGVKDEVLVPMTPLGGTDRRLLLFRDEGSPDFSEREKAMLALARPHVAELHTRRDRELRGEPNLTPRQWEVLRQVATGASNTQIARTLGLSEATVRKHLENVFLRLGVQSRTEALARVQRSSTRPSRPKDKVTSPSGARTKHEPETPSAALPVISVAGQVPSRSSSSRDDRPGAVGPVRDDGVGDGRRRAGAG